ncbi:secondary thiamine-phosphate synthase enzyme YjbQ [Ethanoligenens harbinense]|uniref:YjbQ family protein n=1 Tax=Ethanoligenens harbinense (strain DSM 18485 / JCM 12961 / CGMCC 1.5033 / YUAN-3) TaxID=663278 RepID=E6U4S0_ETHHY|nr:secondary thiamine-phosphate synthase enzyme YjbQ [Ethanoligenens harbinense]ADU27805.1 protein of unknown function UPF0047 [Ethanoligenens harbinense YUAN-3]AVQ96829.1 hypothetical protein CXQ68_11795 [Ethanoligenens harbinense YUAN-3]AYF39491.1 hypothetical protein CXP51_11690 [Ethanoligenens harbinense]AYF42316.1 hypothetical protein CN246_12240 [Ethanoligenens harbinense]QCN93070.1 YjbQ family protein [Ethanoligenens harbinense]
MALFLKTCALETMQREFIDITRTVELFVQETGVREGLCLVFCPHTTAGVTINENADPDVLHDLNYTFERAFPKLPAYLHMEGNSDAHMKSTLTGASETVIIHGGRLLLGRWQGLYFCEYDGPRTRKFLIKVLEG